MSKEEKPATGVSEIPVAAEISGKQSHVFKLRNADLPCAEPRQYRINKKARIRTRSKLLCAARSVFGCKGIESTAINDITEEAGVSFGSFYNYFSSKKEIARAVFIDETLLMLQTLDSIPPMEGGIAEILDVKIRLILHKGVADPVWGWFFIHSAYSISEMMDVVGNHLARDIRIGKEAKIFLVDDVDSTVDGIMGGILYLLRKILEGARSSSAVQSLVQHILAGLGVSRGPVC
ncbi:MULTISPECIES: TetR/AcrR family transcriptional regulator [Pseudomonas]|uniref:TetR/AcrR family transcriptional regulator n=1 Tax=Pseudomonas TaxID=286 RepID=UPI0006201650|nr:MULTISPECIES: TetR/AcrR family transcriptional regulator [unclassified Pseudomonas]KIY42364.1 hypothetical protein TZ03_03640 [Pseudomonas sp. 10-1B]